MTENEKWNRRDFWKLCENFPKKMQLSQPVFSDSSRMLSAGGLFSHRLHRKHWFSQIFLLTKLCIKWICENRAEGAKHYSPTPSERSERHVGCAFPTPPRRAEGAKEWVGELPFQGAVFYCWHNTQGAAALALGYAWIALSGRFSSNQTYPN